jgi:hypothetical protein
VEKEEFEQCLSVYKVRIIPGMREDVRGSFVVGSVLVFWFLARSQVHKLFLLWTVGRMMGRWLVALRKWEHKRVPSVERLSETREMKEEEEE